MNVKAHAPPPTSSPSCCALFRPRWRSFRCCAGDRSKLRAARSGSKNSNDAAPNSPRRTSSDGESRASSNCLICGDRRIPSAFALGRRRAENRSRRLKMSVGASESKESTRVQSSSPSSTTAATKSDPQKTDVAARVDRKTDADAGRIADRITGPGDTIDVSARAQLKGDAPVTATADANAAYADADRALQEMDSRQWAASEDA